MFFRPDVFQCGNENLQKEVTFLCGVFKLDISNLMQI
jgi:hypothetical protein